MRRLQRGFTIVELLIVILVIGILAAIVVANYNGIQDRAKDAKIRDAADKVVDAVQLFVSNKGHFPKGGWGSTVAIGSNAECPDGAEGFFGTGSYACTVEDTLVASGYLPKNFSVDLLPNTPLGVTTGRASIVVYNSSAATRKAMVGYYMLKPTSQDTANFNTEGTECGYNPAGVYYIRDSLYMKNGTCFNY